MSTKQGQTMVQSLGFVTDGECLTVTHMPVVVMDGWTINNRYLNLRFEALLYISEIFFFQLFSSENCFPKVAGHGQNRSKGV
jgi:hypothetical protein